MDSQRACLGFLAAAVLVLPAWAQIRDLATTGDGGELYFSTSLPPRGAGMAHQGRIFRWTPDAGVTLFAERERTGGAITNFYWLERPWVSLDGAEVRYHAWRDCTSTSMCIYESHVNTVGWNQHSGDATETYSGALISSRNGRYWLSLSYPVIVHAAYLEGAPIPGKIPQGARDVVSDFGKVLLTRGEEPRLWLWSQASQTRLEAPDATLGLAVTSDERYVIYQGLGADGGRLIRSLEVASGAIGTLVADATEEDGGETPVSLTADGGTALLLVRVAADLPRQWIVLGDVVGGGAEWHTYLEEGFREAVISGDGQVIYAVAESGRLFRFVNDRREWTELVKRTPYITGVEGSPVPGSLNRLTGGGFTWAPCEAEGYPLPASLCGVVVEYLGKPGRILRVTPSEIVFQSSWEAPLPLPPGGFPIVVEHDFVSVDVHEEGVFAMPQVGRIRGAEAWQFADRPPEDDSGRPLSWGNPARPERRFVVFMHGLGPVDPPVEDGMPGPEQPVARVLEGFFAGVSLPSIDYTKHLAVDLEVVSAELAPGEFGLYRVELRIPAITNADHCSNEVINDLRIRFEDRPSRRPTLHLPIPFRCR